jgi:predicted GTPase
MDDARPEDVATVRRNAREWNPRARVVEGRSPVRMTGAEALAGKRVLVVEDGPTATHGGMGYGAGFLAATRAGAVIVDPRPFARGEIARAYARYPHLRAVVPALGYREDDVADLEATIDRTPCDAVVVGTPIDLARVVRMRKPHYRAVYGFEESGGESLAAILRERFARGP